MKIIIIRHGKVKHIWKKNCSSDEFNKECELYDTAPVEELSSAAYDDVSRIYISTLDRSFLTAKMIYGTRNFCRTELINEVPVKASFDTKLKLPTWFWHMSGRIQWMAGSKRQPETRKQTIERAERFTREITNKNEDCVLITHGFFMHTLISVMKSRGFKVKNNSIHYKNGAAVILTL